jgi:hypothetical protein
MSEASVVDFPDPTHPVIRTSPLFLCEKLLMILGIFSSSNSGILSAIILKTRPNQFFCLNAFTLNLPNQSIWSE